LTPRKRALSYKTCADARSSPRLCLITLIVLEAGIALRKSTIVPSFDSAVRITYENPISVPGSRDAPVTPWDAAVVVIACLNRRIRQVTGGACP
jgi:hypothetical protein